MITYIIIALCISGDHLIIEYSSRLKCEVERGMLVDSGIRCDFKCIRIGER